MTSTVPIPSVAVVTEQFLVRWAKMASSYFFNCSGLLHSI